MGLRKGQCQENNLRLWGLNFNPSFTFSIVIILDHTTNITILITIITIIIITILITLLL